MKLQEELKQSKPFGSLEEEVILNILRTAESFTARAAEMLKPAELTPTQYNALRILRGAGPEGLSCGEIGSRMVTKDSDITRLLDRLEKRKLVRRERPDNNRRIVLTRITDKGLKLLAELDGVVHDFERQLVGHLGPLRLKTLKELLEASRT
jgi:DNA-binding MarR family transcriptional regulator